MGYLENLIFTDTNKKPLIYARYVDEIFFMCNNVKQFEKLRQDFQENSVLKFTIENIIKNKIPFLDWKKEWKILYNGLQKKHRHWSLSKCT